MSMRCKVNNRITLPKLCSTTLEEEVMEDKEDMKGEVDIEVEKEVEEHLAEEEDRLSVINADNRVTSHETI